jgi:hypothetical protein
MRGEKDIFGLDREKRIQVSGVRSVFTPHQPVQAIELFFGRQAEVQKLVEQINTPGQHALLYGDRGVGKSSLANVAAKLLLRHIAGGTLYVARCDSSTHFLDIVAEPLRAAGLDPSVTRRTCSHTEGGEAGLKIPIARAGVRSERGTTETYEDRRFSPARVAEVLSATTGLLLVDETDGICHQTDKRKLAELVKLLSDTGSPFKLLIVGIAQIGEELTGGHPSVQRCLKETKLNRMSERELSEIVVAGARKLSLTFHTQVVSSIVDLSAGYPHFTHLIALKCAEDAIASRRREVNLGDLNAALSRATQDAEGSLLRMYQRAVRSHGTSMYRTILLAAANIDASEFSAQELRRAVAEVNGEAVTQQSMNNYLKRLVSAGSGTMMKRTAKGVYRFNDPRMPSYIRIASAEVSRQNGNTPPA